MPSLSCAVLIVWFTLGLIIPAFCPLPAYPPRIAMVCDVRSGIARVSGSIGRSTPPPPQFFREFPFNSEHANHPGVQYRVIFILRRCPVAAAIAVAVGIPRYIGT